MPLFSTVKSIQQISTTGGDVTISAVNPLTTVVQYNGVPNNTGANISAQLTNPTTVTATSAGGVRGYFTVLESY